MFGRRASIAVLIGVLTIATACTDDTSLSGPTTLPPLTTTSAAGSTGTGPSGGDSSSTAETDPEATNETDPESTADTGTESTDETDPEPTSATEPEARPTTTTSLPASSTSTSTTGVALTSTTVPSSDVPATPTFDPACVVVVAPGDSLSLIADRFDDDTVTVPAIRTENGIVGDNIDPGDRLDVCVANGLNDVTGQQRTEADAVAVATLAVVEAQQRQLNQLFAGLGTPELLVDGISGRVTRQRLCAARLALGLPVSTTDMLADSPEEQTLMAATTLPIPFTTAIVSERWILIDQTCQMMFVGEGTSRLVFVFPTSTGEPGHETRIQDRSRAFRFNPALGNGGWHNSTVYPVADDNPLNGNMYKPIYFDRGQAIHGANNVPTNPQSKGCARLRVEHQEMLIGWLGLGDVTTEIRDSDRINVTVNVHGAYVPT